MRWASFLAALVLVLGGQRLLLRDVPVGISLAVYACGLGLFVVLQRAALTGCKQPKFARGREKRLRLVQWFLIGGVLVASLEIWLRASGRPETDSYSDVVLLWLLAMATSLLAAGWPETGWRAMFNHPRVGVGRAGGRRTCGAIAGIVGVSLILRTVMLDRFPSIVDSNGTSFAMSAVDVLNGRLRNPFTTGFSDNPTLFAYLQAATIWVFGRSIEGAAMVSAFFGTLAVLFTWLFARRTLGVRTAFIAAAVLAVFHYHLFFSRTALSNAADPFFLVATLFLLDRALVERRRIDCLLTGFAIGFSQYFYFSGRIVPVVAVGYAVVFAFRRSKNTSGADLRHAAGLTVWIIGGALVVYLPLLAHYADQPEDYSSRFNQVSIFARGWLDQQRHATGMSLGGVLAQHTLDAVLAPFRTRPVGPFYRPDPPLLGVPLAMLTAIGLAIATVGAFRRKYAALAIAWWAAIGGVALTQQPESQRLLIIAPLVAILSAIALDTVLLITTRLLGVPQLLSSVVVAGAVIALAFSNIAFFFRESNALKVYGDPNSLVATRLGEYLRASGKSFTVYFAGAPQMTYESHSAIVYLAPKSHGVDLNQPLLNERSVPDAVGPTLFVFLHDRERELRFVRTRFPHGRLRYFRSNRRAAFRHVRDRPAHTLTGPSPS